MMQLLMPMQSVRRPWPFLFAFLLPLMLPPGAQAQAEGDIIQIPLSQQGDTSVARPSKGMKQAEVESKFGAPESRQGPVGTPPITRWHYPAFVVTFEHDHVVHTVLKHKPVVVPAETAPEPTQSEESNPLPAEPDTPTP